MKKILYLLYSNTKNNIGKLILLLLAFSLSAMSIILSIDFKKVTYNAVWNSLRSQTCGIHLNIQSNQRGALYFDSNEAENVLKENSNVESYTCLHAFQATLNEQKRNVYGLDYSCFQNIGLIVSESSDCVNENGAYISNNLSKLYSIDIGDSVSISTDNGIYSLIVDGIVNDSVFTVQNGDPILISRNFAEEITSENGKVSTVFVTAISFNAIDVIYNQITTSLADFDLKITKVFNPSDSTFYLEPLSIAIMIFSVFSIFTSIGLCYYVYKSVILGMVKKIAIQKSIGVSSKQLWLSAILESLILTFFSWIIGVVLSLIIMLIMSTQFTGVSVSTVSALSVIISFVVLLFISMLCVFLTHSKVLSCNIVELIKGRTDIYSYKKGNVDKVRLAFLCKMLPLLVFLIILVLLFVLPSDSKLMLVAKIIIGIASTAFIAYYFSKSVFLLLSLFLRKNSLCLALYNKQIANRRGIIIIMVLIICLISMSTTISSVLSETMSSYYSSIDIMMLTTNEEVADSALLDEKYNINKTCKCLLSTVYDNETTLHIEGVNTEDYLLYCQDSFVSCPGDEMMEILKNNEDGIIVSTTLANRMNLELNDTLKLTTNSGEIAFTVIGLVNSYENGGNNIIISSTGFSKYFYKQTVYYYIILNDEQTCDQFINDFFNDNKEQFRTLSIYRMTDLVNQNNKSINSIFTVVYFLIVLLVCIAIINVIFSISLSIESRFKMYAIQYSIGKSHIQLIQDIICENAVILLCSGFISVLSVGVLNYYIFKLLNVTVGYFEYDYQLSVIGILATLLICGISLLLPIRKFNKIDKIQCIKGEEE